MMSLVYRLRKSLQTRFQRNRGITWLFNLISEKKIKKLSTYKECSTGASGLEPNLICSFVEQVPRNNPLFHFLPLEPTFLLQALQGCLLYVYLYKRCLSILIRMLSLTHLIEMGLEPLCRGELWLQNVWSLVVGCLGNWHLAAMPIYAILQ